MTQLPQELVDAICGSLGREDLRSAYDVSTKFRKAAKRLALKYKDDFWSTRKGDNVDKFIQYYSGFRLRYLREVQLEIYFPELKNEERGCFETEEERREKDTALTEQVQWFFRILKLIEERLSGDNHGSYRLTINVIYHVDDHCHHREHAQWRTHLLTPATLPELNSVTSLHVNNERSSAKLDYIILVDLAERLPKLNYLTASMGQDEWTPDCNDEPASLFIWDYDGVRRDARHAFGESVTSSKICRRLREVDLDFFCPDAMSGAKDIHQLHTMPDLVRPYLFDVFSTGLRLISYHLRRMVLRAQVDDTLFWPSDGTTPHWPCLEYIHLMFYLVSPSGTWYFIGPRGEGKDMVGHEVSDASYPPLDEPFIYWDEHLNEYWDCSEHHRAFELGGGFHFRISPNEDVLGPFLASFAKATAHMPQLKRAVLCSPLMWEIDGDDEARPTFEYMDDLEEPKHNFEWGFAYEAPGLRHSSREVPEHRYCNSRQIWWKVGNWRPEEKLHHSLQEIGSLKHGETLKEYWENVEVVPGFVSAQFRNFDAERNVDELAGPTYRGKFQVMTRSDSGTPIFSFPE